LHLFICIIELNSLLYNCISTCCKYIAKPDNLQDECAMYAKVYTSTHTHTHPPFSFHRPCHPGARLPPGRRESGTPSLTRALSGCVIFFTRSRGKRSRIPACLAAVGLRDDKVAGAKRKEGCGCGCARKHRVKLKILENDSWRSEKLLIKIYIKS